MSLHLLPPLTRVTGTRVWLPRPEHFVETTHFTGWADPESGAVLMATELPEPYERLAEGLSGLGGAPGVRLLSHEPLAAGEHTGLLLHVEQEQRGILFDKWMAVLGDVERSVMVVGSARSEHGPELSRFLRMLVAGVRWQPGSGEPVEPAPFLLAEPMGLREAGRIQHGLLYTPDGRAPDAARPGPQLLLTPLPMSPVGDVSSRELAEIALPRTPGVTDVVLEASTSVLVQGLRGHEVVAHARESDGGRACFLYLLVLTGPQGPVLVQGRGPEELRETELPRLQAAARSVRAAQGGR